MDIASPALQDDAAPATASRALPRFAAVTAGATVALIGAGALVTSTGSGLAYEDWPLADGQLWPERMPLEGLIEHGHRAFASLVGLMVLVQAIWIGVTQSCRRLRWAGVTALFLVALQGVIGGKGVEWGLPHYTSVAHGILAQITVCLLAVIAASLSPEFKRPHDVPAALARTARGMGRFTLIVVVCTLTAGAILRHTNYTGALWAHVFMAVTLALTMAITCMWFSSRLPGKAIRVLATGGLTLIMVQLLLGMTTLAVRAPKDPTNIERLGPAFVISGHVVVGALIMMTAVLLTFRAYVTLRPSDGDAPQ